MSLFTSDTKQIQSPHAWTYIALHTDESGDCWAAERNGLRDIKAKGLIVRYPNPFTASAKEATPEVIYETSDAIDAYWRSPQKVGGSEHHVFAKTKHHFLDAKGKWKKVEVITKRAQRFVMARGFGERLLIALGGDEAYVELVGGKHRPLDIANAGCAESIGGTGPDDIYVATDGAGIHHFNGAKWTALEGSPKSAHLVSASKEVVYATGIDPEEGRIFKLYRGNAKDGFTGLVPCKPEDKPDLSRLTLALGRLYLTQSHDEGRGLFLYDEKKKSFDPIVQATSYTGRLVGNEKVLWLENGIELLCTDGKSWKKVPRVHHDRSKA